MEIILNQINTSMHLPEWLTHRECSEMLIYYSDNPEMWCTTLKQFLNNQKYFKFGETNRVGIILS